MSEFCVAKAKERVGKSMDTFWILHIERGGGGESFEAGMGQVDDFG